jgi:hypothetical protein
MEFLFAPFSILFFCFFFKSLRSRSSKASSMDGMEDMGELEHELELIQTQMAQKPMLRAEVYARALRAIQKVKSAEVWVGAQCA